MTRLCAVHYVLRRASLQVAHLVFSLQCGIKVGLEAIASAVPKNSSTVGSGGGLAVD